MAVGPAILKWSGKELERTKDESGRAFRTPQEIYTVTCAPSDSEYAIELASGLPQFGDGHSDDTYARLRRRRVIRLSPVFAEVHCTYEARGEDNPLNEDADVRWFTIKSEEEIDQDANGDPICTAIGEPYDPPLRANRSIRAVVITKNMASYYDGLASLFEDSTNSDTFMGYAAGTCYCSSIEATRVVSDALTYWAVTVEIHIRGAHPGSTADKAWYKRVAHQGYYVKITNASDPMLEKVIRVPDFDGEPATRPFLLNSDASNTVEPASTVWKYYQVYHEMDFNLLGLGV